MSEEQENHNNGIYENVQENKYKIPNNSKKYTYMTTVVKWYKYSLMKIIQCPNWNYFNENIICAEYLQS